MSLICTCPLFLPFMGYMVKYSCFAPNIFFEKIICFFSPNERWTRWIYKNSVPIWAWSMSLNPFTTVLGLRGQCCSQKERKGCEDVWPGGRLLFTLALVGFFFFLITTGGSAACSSVHTPILLYSHLVPDSASNLGSPPVRRVGALFLCGVAVVCALSI